MLFLNFFAKKKFKNSIRSLLYFAAGGGEILFTQGLNVSAYLIFY
jgi:hypothetical protein